MAFLLVDMFVTDPECPIYGNTTIIRECLEEFEERDSQKAWTNFFQMLELVFLFVFAVDIIARFYSYGFSYFRDLLNCLDAVIVFSLLAMQVRTCVSPRSRLHTCCGRPLGRASAALSSCARRPTRGSLARASALQVLLFTAFSKQGASFSFLRIVRLVRLVRLFVVMNKVQKAQRAYKKAKYLKLGSPVERVMELLGDMKHKVQDKLGDDHTDVRARPRHGESVERRCAVASVAAAPPRGRPPAPPRCRPLLAPGVASCPPQPSPSTSPPSSLRAAPVPRRGLTRQPSARRRVGRRARATRRAPTLGACSLCPAVRWRRSSISCISSPPTSYTRSTSVRRAAISSRAR
jgi:hypothetical protein